MRKAVNRFKWEIEQEEYRQRWEIIGCFIVFGITILAFLFLFYFCTINPSAYDLRPQ